MNQDPFDSVKESVTIAIDRAQESLATWKVLNQKMRTAQEEKKLNELTETIKTDLEYIFEDLGDLEDAASPERFALTQLDIDQRHAFIRQKKKEAKDVGNVVTQKRSSAKLTPRPSPNQALRDNDHTTVDFDSEHQQQQLMISQQDEHLDSVLGTVRNLQGIASTMNNELGEQSIMLDEVTGMVDNTMSKLELAKRKVNKFLTDKSSSSIRTIVILFVVVLVLLLLIIWT
ncbi:hypothetical protein H4219_002731 [Mycoemilia scoparia]|uniref:t-SNARE coiled-coil homology domain-containing protein n=1 Tax=Mycoemilia scoparia TaxID=417184 RepID=A0A9W7ZWU5_9FUNG|nr:hypothetical protein H4219_002731 [Mycoemilia scoparia]